MKQHSENKARYFLPVKTIAVMVVMLSVIAVMASAFKDKDNAVNK